MKYYITSENNTKYCKMTNETFETTLRNNLIHNCNNQIKLFFLVFMQTVSLKERQNNL